VLRSVLGVYGISYRDKKVGVFVHFRAPLPGISTDILEIFGRSRFNFLSIIKHNEQKY
jgi:hypothetical protein